MTFLSISLLILVALGAGATTLAIVISIRAAREASSTIFPIVREEEAARALRARIASVFFLALTAVAMGGWLAAQGQLPLSTVASQPQPQVAESEATFPAVPTLQGDAPVAVIVENTAAPPTATFTPPLEPTRAPTETSPPASATRSPTAPPATTPPPPNTPTSPAVQLVTETVVFTGTGGQAITTTTPISTPVAATPTLTVTRGPAPPGAQMGPISFALDITDRREAIAPSEVFTAPVDFVYGVFPYDGMQNGLTFSAIWYHNDQEFLRSEQAWEWGATDRSFVYTGLVGPGSYKLELMVNDTLVATGTFRVR